MKWIAIAVLGCSMVVSAQTAKVVQLTPDEAKQAKVLHDEQIALSKRQSDFDQAIAAKYTTEERKGGWICIANGCTEGSTKGTKQLVYRDTKEGWNLGFVYSDDFKFIVPKTYTPPASTTSPCWTNTNSGFYNCGGNLLLTPAYTVQ